MDYLDTQMQQWSSRLRDDLRVVPPASLQLATTISQEACALPGEAKQRVKDVSPIPVAVRLEELRAFQIWMDRVRATDQPHPAIVRAQVVTEIYFCFVYLGEACFRALKDVSPTGSTTKKCCKFLTDNPIGAFRNAIAHGNWRYLADFSGLEFWARKGAVPTENPSRFEVSQHDLEFWQILARCTAYSAFLSL